MVVVLILWLYLSCTVIMHQPACDSNNAMFCLTCVCVMVILLNFNSTKVQIKAQIWLVTLRHMCIYWCIKYWPIELQLWKVLEKAPKLHLRRTQMTWECRMTHSFTLATVEIRGKSKTWKWGQGCQPKSTKAMQGMLYILAMNSQTWLPTWHQCHLAYHFQDWVLRVDAHWSKFIWPSNLCEYFF